jgi:hypothetical protein
MNSNSNSESDDQEAGAALRSGRNLGSSDGAHGFRDIFRQAFLLLGAGSPAVSAGAVEIDSRVGRSAPNEYA